MAEFESADRLGENTQRVTLEVGLHLGVPVKSGSDRRQNASLARVFEPAPFEGTLSLSGGTPLDRG